MGLKTVLNAALDVIYPPRCMVCLDIIPLDRPKWICAECDGLLETIAEPVCARCGAGAEPGRALCAGCSSKHPHEFLTGNRALFIYDDITKRLIYNFKYLNHPEIAEGLAQFLSGPAVRDYLRADILTYVPLHRRRLYSRGFNQAEAFAKNVSAVTGVPSFNLLSRGRDTKPQSLLHYQSRLENLTNAFKINKKTDIRGKDVLVIDDIYTTGATLEACAKELKNGGAARVRGFTVAVAVKDS